MGLSTRIGIGAGMVAAVGAALLLGPLDVADAHRDGRAQPEMVVERVDCHRTEPGGSTARTLPAVSSAMQQDITVTVPRTALVRVDAAGNVRAAATNTGCAPRAGDDLYVIAPDGSMTLAQPGDFARQHWVGDFTSPGRFVEQDHSVAGR